MLHSIVRIAIAVNLDRNLVMERLLMLLWGVERHCCRRLNACYRHSLLRSRLVHRNWVRSVLTEGRLLRKWVGLRTRKLIGSDLSRYILLTTAVILRLR